VAVLIGATGFAFLSGGYIPQRATPFAVALLLLAAVWVWLVRPQRPSVLYLAALAAFTAFTLWVGASTMWSFGPDLSWNAFNLSLLYLAVAAAVGLTPARRLQLRVLSLAFVALCAAVGLYAFAGKTLPDVVTHAQKYGRLDSPVGYWNVLALLMAMGIVVAVALASRAHSPIAVRAAAAAAAVPMAFAFFFSYSRGGYVALAVGLLIYFAVTTTRLASSVTLALIVAPAAVAVWWVRDLDTLFTATTDDALRAAEGGVLLRWSLLALAVTAVLQVAVALLHRRLPWPRWLRIAAGAVLLAVVLGGSSGAGWLFVRDHGGGEWVRQQYRLFVTDGDERTPGADPGRVFSLNTGRPPLWREALEQYRVLPAKGTGAGTFFFTHERFRRDGGVVKHAHSQWLNVLSELGWIGLALFAAAMALFAAASFRRLFRDRGERERPLLAALQAGVFAFLVHISWDWDWDMAVAGSIFFLFAAASAAFITTRSNDLADSAALTAPPETGAPSPSPDGEETRAQGAAGAHWEQPVAVWMGPTVEYGRSGRHGAVSHIPLPVRIALSGLALLAAFSWLPPYLGERAAVRAVSAAGVGELTLALREAEKAHGRNPLAVRPLITQALVQQQLGRGRSALETLDRAVALQPQNADVHYHRGIVLLRALGRSDEAAEAFRRALELDPFDNDSAFQLRLALQAQRREGG
jgi:tetratricopeptide (TPR) repeat protein